MSNMTSSSPGDSVAATLTRLVSHSVWANRKWIEFVYLEQSPPRRAEELLAHLVIGERVWFDRIAGMPQAREMFQILPKNELLQRLEENEHTFSSLIASRLNDLIYFKRGTGE